MYKITNVTARDGKTVKPERIGRTVYNVDKITDIMSGKSWCYAEYSDQDNLGKALCTSEEILRTEGSDTGKITVVTQNSIYTFEKV